MAWAINVQSWIYTSCLEVAGPQFSTDSGACLPVFKSWLCPLWVCDSEQDLGPTCTLGSGPEAGGKWHLEDVPQGWSFHRAREAPLEKRPLG